MYVKGRNVVVNQMKLYLYSHLKKKKKLPKIDPEFLKPLKPTFLVKTSRKKTEVEKRS